MTRNIAWNNNETLFRLFERDDPATLWSKGSLPTGQSIGFQLLHAAGAQYLQPALSLTATSAVAWTVYGFDSTLDDV